MAESGNLNGVSPDDEFYDHMQKNDGSQITVIANYTYRKDEEAEGLKKDAIKGPEIISKE